MFDKIKNKINNLKPTKKTSKTEVKEAIAKLLEDAFADLPDEDIEKFTKDPKEFVRLRLEKDAEKIKEISAKFNQDAPAVPNITWIWVKQKGFFIHREKPVILTKEEKLRPCTVDNWLQYVRLLDKSLQEFLEKAE